MLIYYTHHTKRIYKPKLLEKVVKKNDFLRGHSNQKTLDDTPRTRIGMPFIEVFGKMRFFYIKKLFIKKTSTNRIGMPFIKGCFYPLKKSILTPSKPA